MRRLCPLICLSLGALSLTLFFATDFAASALGRHMMKELMKGFYNGSCPDENPSPVRQGRDIFIPLQSSIPFFSVSDQLGGLQLGIHFYPYTLEEKGGSLSFTEMGVWSLKVEVDGSTTWVMHDPDRSSMTQRQPINNINLLTVLVPMVVEEMIPGILPEGYPQPSISFRNMSIVDRVGSASDIAEDIMGHYNISKENNILRMIHKFILSGGQSALGFRDSTILVATKESSSNKKSVLAIPPLLPLQLKYTLPGLNDLVFEYWRSGQSWIRGLSVDSYTLKDLWKSSILCRLTNTFLFNLYKRLQSFRVYLTSPGSVENKAFDIISLEAPFAAILDVYRPFAVPIGGKAAVQTNFYIPNNDTFGTLGGTTTPVMRTVVTLDQLPDHLAVSIVFFTYVRVGLFAVFLGFSCLFLLSGLMSFICRRSSKRPVNYALLSTPL